MTSDFNTTGTIPADQLERIEERAAELLAERASAQRFRKQATTRAHYAAARAAGVPVLADFRRGGGGRRRSAAVG